MPATTELMKPYEPTSAERRVLEAQRSRRQQQRLSIRATASMKGDAVSLQPDHADAAFGHLLLMDALGTTQPDFSDGLLAQLANAATAGTRSQKTEPQRAAANFAVPSRAGPAQVGRRTLNRIVAIRVAPPARNHRAPVWRARGGKDRRQTHAAASGSPSSFAWGRCGQSANIGSPSSLGAAPLRLSG